MILGLDVGASNIKAALVDWKTGETKSFQVPSFPSGDAYSALVAVRNDVLKATSRGLEAIAVTCSPFLQTTTYEESIFGIDESIGKVFKRCMAPQSQIAYLGRDGQFRRLRQVIKDVRSKYLNVVKYVDANWLPLVFLVRETQRISNFTCASFGTSSTSLIPVVKGRPQVGLTENRLSSSKLLLMGKLYTPVVSFTDELEFRGASIPWNPYDNQLTIGEVAFSSGYQGPRPWTATERDIRFAIRKRVSWSVGGDIKLVTRDEIKDLCAQIVRKYRARLIERVKAVIEGVPPEASTVYVCGTDNRFFIDLVSPDIVCVDTGLDNASTAYGTALLYCQTENGGSFNHFLGSASRNLEDSSEILGA